MDHQPVTVTIGRQHLIDALDTLADVAITLENNADKGIVFDHDQLITSLRTIIHDLTSEIETADLLS